MAFTNSMPAPLFFAATKVTTPAEQKLKLEKREEFLNRMISKCQNDIQAKLSFQNDLAVLREMQAHVVPEEVIQQRCERLIDLCHKHNIRIRDNRAAYRERNAEAVANEVARLCGGAA